MCLVRMDPETDSKCFSGTCFHSYSCTKCSLVRKTFTGVLMCCHITSSVVLEIWMKEVFCMCYTNFSELFIFKCQLQKSCLTTEPWNNLLPLLGLTHFSGFPSLFLPLALSIPLSHSSAVCLLLRGHAHIMPRLTVLLGAPGELKARPGGTQLWLPIRAVTKWELPEISSN